MEESNPCFFLNDGKAKDKKALLLEQTGRGLKSYKEQLL